MNTKEYTPHPIDTSEIELSDELMELAEQLAENVHEVWSQTRIGQGWTYGPQRDDAKKHHPCLIAYGDLTEDEKVYDRETSQQTLKVIQKLGFEIKKRK